MSERRPPRPRPPPAQAARRVEGSRLVAARVLDRVRERDAFANLVLPRAVTDARLEPRDAALASELVYGTLRMRAALDWVLSLHADRPLSEVDPPVLDRLRLGAYQLLFTQVPAYAAVSETVELVGAAGAQRFANAILRRVADQKDAIPWPSREGDLEAFLRVRYSHPGWIVRLWLEELGPRDTEQLCAANNIFPGIGLRVNTARTTTADAAARLREAGLEVEEGRWSRDALLVRGGGAPSKWPGWSDGWLSVQDEGSVLTGEAVPAGGTVVDLCAGPGGKSAHLAVRCERLVALELHERRTRLVEETFQRLGRTARTLAVQADGRLPPVRDESVDAVLVDAPCSGLGVLRRRPEARWRIKPAAVDGLARLQEELLVGAWPLLRPGGVLVYAVCTVTRAETLEVVERFLDRVPGAGPQEVLPEVPRHRAGGPYLQMLPHVHGTDGMFIAAFRKEDRSRG